MIRTIFTATLLLTTSLAASQVHAQDFVIPVHIHDAGLLQPDGALASERYLEVSIESANRWFADAGVCFFVQAHQPFPASERYEEIRTQLPRGAAVHAAVVRQVSHGGSLVRGVATRWERRSGTLALSRLRANRLTMAHELGHVLGLPHSESGVMHSGRDWWNPDEQMTRSDIRTVRRGARDFATRFGTWPASRCVRHTVPEASDIGPDDALLVHGTRTYSSGSRYVGTLLFGRRHGLGSFEYSDGATYEGMWSLGKRHGHGTFIRRRWRYTGDWNQGQREGQGQAFYSSGGVYEGAFVHGQRHGLGEFRYARGGYYRGSWHRGLRAGFGQYAYPNGGRYEGRWRADERHGFGVYVYNSGRRVVGEWRNGRDPSARNTCSFSR